MDDIWDGERGNGRADKNSPSRKDRKKTFFFNHTSHRREHISLGTVI